MQDKENVQKESEKQMNELCATLEKYKVDLLCHTLLREFEMYFYSLSALSQSLPVGYRLTDQNSSGFGRKLVFQPHQA